MSALLVAFGTILVVVGAAALSEERERPRRGGGTRLEFVVLCAVLIGGGVAMAYAGVAA
jgi:hypothetical protein